MLKLLAFTLYIALFLFFCSCSDSEYYTNDVAIIDEVLRNQYYSLKLCDFSSVDIPIKGDNALSSLMPFPYSTSNKKLYDSLHTSSLSKIPCLDKYYFGKTEIEKFKTSFFFQLFTGENSLIEAIFIQGNSSLLKKKIEEGSSDDFEKMGIQNRIYDFLEKRIILSSSKIKADDINFRNIYPNTSLNIVDINPEGRFVEQLRMSDILYNKDLTKAVININLSSHNELNEIFFLEKFGERWEIAFLEMQ